MLSQIVQIWNKALSESEIQDRMYRPIDQSDSLWNDLSGYYRMDWGTGTKAYDYSSNLNHGTLTNGPEWIESHSWDKGLLSHYKLNGNTFDQISSERGSVEGAKASSDRHGFEEKAYEFNGSSDYIELNDIPIAGVESASISLWFKTNSSSHTSGEGHLVQIGKNLSGKFGFGVNIKNNGNIRAVMSKHNHSSDYFQKTSSESFNVGRLAEFG